MSDTPFRIFAPYADRFTVEFFGKADNLRTDADLARLTGSPAIASLWQSHEGQAVILREPVSRQEKADAAATDVPGLWLSIRAADCQQFVVYDPVHHAAGVIHAGWKGLKAGIIPSLFRAMNREWGTVASETFVGIGPSLCMACAEFTDPVTELEGLDPAFFHGRNADLRGIADAQLEALGIPAAQRERNPDCTKCMSSAYWSYRGGDREKVLEGSANILVCRLK